MACATALAAPSVAAEERKTVTTLFCDLVGFTALSEAADPEVVDALLREYFSRATEAIEAQGGVVEKFIGDAVVGVFGVPAVHEDDPERAVRAGLRILADLEGLTRPEGASLEARVGVNTGLAVVRLDVAPGSGEGFLTGDAVNTAARLQGAAPPMGVVVGELAHHLSADAFIYEELTPLALKGKAGRVKAWLAKGSLAGDGRRRLSVTRAQMVGRERELAAAADALARLQDGSGGLLLITGEAGIGKTRLVEEFRTLVAREGCAWLEGHTLSFGRSISYWPLLEIVQQDAGIAPDDAEAERAVKLASRVETLCGELTPEILPYLATLLSLPVAGGDEEKLQRMDGEAMGRQLYRASRLYFARLAEERPLVVSFEDVHWMDDSSAALLEHLLPLVREVPLLFCCVSRPELDSPLTRIQELARTDYADRARHIALDALSTSQSTALVQELTGAGELPATLKEIILAKAQGNPFFVEEIVRSLVDLGGLERVESTGSYRVTPRAGSIAIPDTLLGVIMARVDRLDDDLKQVLRLAAVIGRTFFYRLLEAIAEADRDLDAGLAGLQQRELVLEKARDPELEYMFKHALVQEATYESILLQRRRDLHRRVAVAVEALFSEQLEESYSLLAYHYSRAEDWEKAQVYLLKAGDQAGSIAADAEALAHYQAAIDAYTRAFGDTWDPVERATLERKMGEALYRRGEHEQASEYLLRALTTLGSPMPASPGGMRRAIVLQIVRHLGHRFLPRFTRGELTPEAGRAVEERCRVYYALGWIGGYADANTALLATLLCLNEGESAGLAWAECGGAAGVIVISSSLPSRRLFRRYSRRARELAEEGGFDFQLATVTFAAGMWEYWVDGDLDASLRSCRQAADSYRDLGDTRRWAAALGVALYVPAERGELAHCLATAREGARLGVETGDRLTEVWWRAWEAELLYLTGDITAGEDGMRRTVDGMLAMLDFRVGAKVAGRLAACYLAQGRLEEAKAVLDEHRALLRTYWIRGGNASGVILGTAGAALMTVERSEGAARTAALKEAKRACRAALKQTKLDQTALVPAWRLKGTYEWLRGRPRKAEECWRQSLDHAERIGCRYEGALTALEMGRRLSDREQLERAEAEFADMGARFFLTQAREILGPRRADPS